MSYYSNSQQDSYKIPPRKSAIIAITGICTSTLILLHSNYKHGLLSRGRYTQIRICTEITAWITLVACCLALYLLNHRSPEADIIINEVLITGLLNYTCQVCDNLVFYFGYLVVAKNTPRWFPLLAGLYIGTVMTVWWTTYVFNGLFIDTNTDTYGNSFLTPTLLLYTWCNVAYNAFFTVAFVKILYRVRVLKSKEYGLPAQIVSTKCTIHFFTSSAGVLELYYDYIPIQAVLIYIIILSCSMHILFNFKIESWFKQRGLRGEGKDGSPAEHDSIGEASLRKTLNGRIVWKEAGPTTSGTAVKGWVLPSSGKGNGILRSSGQYLKKKVVVVPTTNN